MASAGVKFVDNLSAFKLKKVATKAADTNKKLGTGDLNVALNPWADAGSLSRDKYFDPDKTTGSAQWKGLLDDNNPDVRDNEFYRGARSFIDKDEKGYQEVSPLLLQLYFVPISYLFPLDILLPTNLKNISYLLDHLHEPPARF